MGPIGLDAKKLPCFLKQVHVISTVSTLASFKQVLQIFSCFGLECLMCFCWETFVSRLCFIALSEQLPFFLICYIDLNLFLTLDIAQILMELFGLNSRNLIIK